jgi:hypothetical protein
MWRDTEPSELSNVDAFSEDPVTVWWFFTDWMARAQLARPNVAHFALARLAKEKEGFFAVNQNIDGKVITLVINRSVIFADLGRALRARGIPDGSDSTGRRNTVLYQMQ